MKKLLAILLAVAMIVCFAACSNTPADDNGEDNQNEVVNGENQTENEGNAEAAALKVGVILIGDENEGYTYSHILGIQEAAKKLNMTDDQIVWKYTIPEDATCTETALDLADQDATSLSPTAMDTSHSWKKLQSRFRM